MSVEIDLVIIADTGGGLAREFKFRLGLDDVHTADEGAAPEQRRLRTFGDLDALQVEKFNHGAARTGNGDAVLEDGDARLDIGFAAV